MFRTVTALGLLTVLATTASAQPRPLPLSPGVMPASPYGPGLPFPAAPIPQQAGPGSPNTVFFPVAMPWGWGLGWGYQTYSPWTGFGYAYGGLVDVIPVRPVTVEPPRRPEPSVVLANEFPATLTLQFPAAADVWLDGKKLSGESGEERVITSPVLKPGERYTFLVKARWTIGSKTFEAKRAVTLAPGDRSRLSIVSGDEVRE